MMIRCVPVRLNEYDMIAAIEDPSIDIMYLDFSEVYPEVINSMMDAVFNAVNKVYTLDRWMFNLTTSHEYGEALVGGLCRLFNRHVAQKQSGVEV
jgi:hypothetical protein